MSDAALDATADALARRALAGLPEAPTRADLAALAPPLARLLDARLAAELERAVPTSAWVDADATEEAREAWRQAAEPTLRIPADLRHAVVQRATERALTHLIRPADTLAAVAFEGEAGPLPAATALDRIRAFGPYPYLVQITERYVERKGLSHIDRAGLERLLRRIDRRMVSAFGADDWMALLEPLFAWVGPTSRTQGSVPTGLLRALFQAKGATALHDTLDEIDTVDAETLHGLMEGVLGPAEAETGLEVPPSTSSSDFASSAQESDTLVPTMPAHTEPVADAGAPLGDHEPVGGMTEPVPLAEPEPDTTIWSTAPPLAPPAERQPGPWETEPAAEPPPSPDTLIEDAETADSDAAPDDLRPPIIGSRYGSPEYQPGDSGVLGPARPLDPMEAVRDAVVEPDDTAPDDGTLGDTASDLPDVADLGEPVEKPGPPVLDIEPPEPAPPDEPAPEPLADAERAEAEPSDDEPLWQRLARERGTEPTPSPALAENAPAVDAPDDQPLWKRFAQSDLAERLPEADVPAPPLAATPPPATLAESFSTPPSSEPPVVASRLPLDDLEERVLGADARERRDWYVTELFGGSPGEYHRTLGAIDAAPSYTDATAIISTDILRKRSVSPYTDCAVAFIDAVQASFDKR